ncbi:MAG: hypothetical protein KDA66_00200 [Planctomycetaceae bacterium]|nr:hypothetical protein [Planctomycetaceae bacterium]
MLWFRSESERNTAARVGLTAATFTLVALTALMLVNKADSVTLTWRVSAFLPAGLMSPSWVLDFIRIQILWYVVLVAWTATMARAQRNLSLSIQLLATTALFVVANDATSLLTGGVWSAICIASGHVSDDDKTIQIPQLSLNLLFAGWTGVFVGLVALAGALSLVRSAPHSAPSATGFLLSSDLSHIPVVTSQHPAADELWAQLRGWVLIPSLIGVLILAGVFPFHGWLKSVNARSSFGSLLWTNAVLTKLPLLYVAFLLLPAYSGNRLLVFVGLAVPSVVGLLIVGAELAAAAVSTRPNSQIILAWGNQLSVLVVALGVLHPASAIWSAVLVMGTASVLWMLTTCNPAGMNRPAGWLSLLVFGMVPVVAAAASHMQLALDWPETETALDVLLWSGFCLATVMYFMGLRFIWPTPKEDGEPTPERTATQWSWMWCVILLALVVTSFMTTSAERLEPSAVSESQVEGD